MIRSKKDSHINREKNTIAESSSDDSLIPKSEYLIMSSEGGDGMQMKKEENTGLDRREIRSELNSLSDKELRDKRDQLYREYINDPDMNEEDSFILNTICKLLRVRASSRNRDDKTSLSEDIDPREDYRAYLDSTDDWRLVGAWCRYRDAHPFDTADYTDEDMQDKFDSFYAEWERDESGR